MNDWVVCLHCRAEDALFTWLKRYAQWLHLQWPADTVEPLPVVNADFTTRVPGLYVVGDLAGVPLLKFAADSGARAVAHLLAEPAWRNGPAADGGADRGGLAVATYDLVIVGAGVAGMSAALAARRAGLRFLVLEAAEAFATVANFPRGKPIFTYPSEMTPAGELRLQATVKEELLAELRRQTLAVGIQPQPGRIERVSRAAGELVVHLADERQVRARRVILAVGRSGDYRRLGVPGEDLDKVSNRLHDPHDFAGQQVLVVGGGDSAVEAALALAAAGAEVTLSYRQGQLRRPKAANRERLAAFMAGAEADRLRLRLGTQVQDIRPDAVRLGSAGGQSETLANDAVFCLIGRAPPVDLLRRCGLAIHGEWRASQWLCLAGLLTLCVALYNWKAWGSLTALFQARGWFPFNTPDWWGSLGPAVTAAVDRPGHLLHTLAQALAEPSFYYTLGYSGLVLGFGLRRIRRRRTPYVTAQTLTLMLVQILPLSLLPYILLPWAAGNGVFEGGVGRWVAETFFPGDSWWRAFGLILAWPLFVYNCFTEQPLWGWLVLSLIQTFVIIPLIVWRWGKGAYCGWLCSCGALAETLGDGLRQRMPHGPRWNRLNLLGQGILALALLIMLLRVLSWLWPSSGIGQMAGLAFAWAATEGRIAGVPVNYKWVVDITLAGIIGVGAYAQFSGRVWCRFACPLAALMHIYARFSRFRIFAEKKKCISCGVCTSVCHQGIAVMAFANQGLPLNDPQCVRCSACVQSCPTGVLQFGHLDASGQPVPDRLSASPTRQRETGQG